MTRGRISAVCIVCVVGFISTAVHVAHADGKTEVRIGVCEPESDPSAVGWEQDPALGVWGGKDESLFAVVWESDAPDKPRLYGREAACTVEGSHYVVPTRIKINYLEGLANDDFCVFVRSRGVDMRVGCFDEESAVEEWKTITFDLPKLKYAKGQDVTVKIFATGDSWSGIGTWGQLAVDWIEVLGVNKKHHRGRGKSGPE